MNKSLRKEERVHRKSKKKLSMTSLIIDNAIDDRSSNISHINTQRAVKCFPVRSCYIFLPHPNDSDSCDSVSAEYKRRYADNDLCSRYQTLEPTADKMTEIVQNTNEEVISISQETEDLSVSDVSAETDNTEIAAKEETNEESEAAPTDSEINHEQEDEDEVTKNEGLEESEVSEEDEEETIEEETSMAELSTE